eukprot:366163-Chlamydomonas_euryale.AAC.9
MDGHLDVVRHIAVSANGLQAASASGDRTVRQSGWRRCRASAHVWMGVSARLDGRQRAFGCLDIWHR